MHLIEMNFYWMPLLVFPFHMAEELPAGPWAGFPAWATRHFGATSTAWYVYSHIVFVLIFVLICSWADRSLPPSWGPILSLSLILTLTINTFFHIVTTIRFREYSTGLVTGTCLILPATGYMIYYIIQNELLTNSQILLALLIGTIAQVGVIASLYLKMDIDWKFRHLKYKT